MSPYTCTRKRKRALLLALYGLLALAEGFSIESAKGGSLRKGDVGERSRRAFPFMTDGKKFFEPKITSLCIDYLHCLSLDV